MTARNNYVGCPHERIRTHIVIEEHYPCGFVTACLDCGFQGHRQSTRIAALKDFKDNARDERLMIDTLRGGRP